MKLIALSLFAWQAMAREHKGKLALDSLLIMPVQRIPRYELLIKVNTACKYKTTCRSIQKSSKIMAFVIAQHVPKTSTTYTSYKQTKKSIYVVSDYHLHDYKDINEHLKCLGAIGSHYGGGNCVSRLLLLLKMDS